MHNTQMYNLINYFEVNHWITPTLSAIGNMDLECVWVQMNGYACVSMCFCVYVLNET